MSTLKTAWINLQDGLGKRFAWSHVKATFYNYADKKLLSTKLDEMDTAIGEKFDKSNVVQTESTATDKVPSAAYLKEIKDGLDNDIGELTSSSLKMKIVTGSILCQENTPTTLEIENGLASSERLVGTCISYVGSTVSVNLITLLVQTDNIRVRIISSQEQTITVHKIVFYR